MDDQRFMKLVEEMTVEDIGNDFFKALAKHYGVKHAAELLLKFDEVYPNATEGQRRIPVHRKSTFTFRANKRELDGPICAT